LQFEIFYFLLSMKLDLGLKTDTYTGTLTADISFREFLRIDLTKKFYKFCEYFETRFRNEKRNSEFRSVHFFPKYNVQTLLRLLLNNYS
jgi:hypothetical protein